MITRKYTVAVASESEDIAAEKSRRLTLFALALNGAGWDVRTAGFGPHWRDKEAK